MCVIRVIRDAMVPGEAMRMAFVENTINRGFRECVLPKRATSRLFTPSLTDQHSPAGTDDQRSNHKDRRGPVQCSVWLSRHSFRLQQSTNVVTASVNSATKREIDLS